MTTPLVARFFTWVAALVVLAGVAMQAYELAQGKGISVGAVGAVVIGGVVLARKRWQEHG